MVKAKSSWLSSHNSSQQLPDLNCMCTLLEPRQQQCLLSHTNQCTCKFSTPVALPGSTGPHLQGSKLEQINEVGGSVQCSPSDFPTPNPCITGKQIAFPSGLSRMFVPNAKYSGPCQKGFLIFDQSENQTRLFYNYVCPPPIQNPSIATARCISSYDDLYKMGHGARTDQIDPTTNMLHEASGENHDSEMHEDTEEINALLYSDDDEDDSDDKCGEDDEVTSTDHSPVQIHEGYGKRGRIEELAEEVASSDGPRKRQKVLDGGYNKSSPMYTASSVNLDGSHGYDNDAKSSYVNGQTGVEGSDCTLGNMRSKKDKIRDILRVLESIIPGVKGKDPLLVIDEAIDYLRIAKLKAKTLGVSFQ
ncbi:hypothetical protein TorRG33x02_168410 [Trema orientale]|uniref:Myc-type, basic helix-loop-helix (BHLH) domain containing protein n=1 Tax=Trema orientale TaxID=63057 RepID=A0A2P5EPB1_TREOI|nr:hypothetical protein TorRG33x02_168410 [Trema orientale]